MTEQLPRTSGECPHCKKQISGYMKEQYYYGSPIVTCRHCGKKYIDGRFHEIALEGVRENALSTKRSGMIALIGIVGAAISAAVNIYMIKTTGRYSLKGVFTTFLGAVLVIGAAVDFIMIKTGVKAKKLERLRMESEQRLSDARYAEELTAAGYSVKE